MMNTLSFLANHLWQSTAFAAVAVLLTLTMKENRAETRFWVFLTASLKFLVPFSLAASIGSYVRWATNVPAAIQSGVLTAIEPFSPLQTSRNLTSPALSAPANSGTWLNYWPMLLIVVWLCGIVVVASLSYRSLRRMSALARRAKRLVAGSEVESMERLSRAHGWAQPVPIFESAVMVEPGLFRIVRPVLL